MDICPNAIEKKTVEKLKWELKLKFFNNRDNGENKHSGKTSGLLT